MGVAPRLLLLPLAIAALAVGGCRSSGSSHTASALEQGGLKLVAAGTTTPAEVHSLGLRENTNPGDVMRVWVEVLDGSVAALGAGPNDLRFELVGSGDSPQKLAAFPTASTKPDHDRQYVAIGIDPGYGPEYENGTLRAVSRGETIAEWKLNGLPKPTKSIADSEPDLVKAEALGYGVRVAGDAAQVGPLSPGFGEVSYANVDLVVNPSPEAAKSADPIEITYRIGRQTWAPDAGAAAGSVTTPPNPSGILSVPLPSRYLDSLTRVEVLLTLRRFRTFVEPVTFRNIRAGSRSSVNGTNVTTFTAASVTTPSGLKITIPEGNWESTGNRETLRVRLRCEQGLSNVAPPSSPLARQTGKRVSIDFGAWRNGVVARFGSEPDKEPNTRIVHIPIVGARKPKGWTIPELKLAVEQRAVLEERQVRLLVPVRR